MTDPALVVTVFIRGGGHGADAAGPVVEQTLSYFLDHEDSVTAVGPAG
jgi:cell division protein FtsI/penicillin-binding protein 2